MKAGELNQRLTLQAPTKIKDSYGSEAITYIDIVTVWGSIITDSGREFFAAQKINAETTAVVKIRYRAGIKSTWRIKFGDRYFDIVAPPNDVNQRHEELHLICKEVV